MKNKGIPVFANKFEFVINLPLEEIYSKFTLCCYDPEFNSNFTTCDLYLDGEGSSLTTHFLLYATSKLGGIFQERDLEVLFRYFRISEDIMIFTFEQSSLIPLNKKFIRTTFYLSGLHFKALSRTSTQITRVYHVDLNGSIPKCKKT